MRSKDVLGRAIPTFVFDRCVGRRAACLEEVVVPHTDGVTESRTGLAPSIEERRNPLGNNHTLITFSSAVSKR